MSMRRTGPDEPKARVAVPLDPTPSTTVTRPSPYLSWLTRSPTSRCRVGPPRPDERMGEGRERDPVRSRPQVRPDPKLVDALGAERSGPLRRQSTTSAGRSAGDRE